ncbi:MAG: hypothetical protein BMS9Abin26_1132 [Gammaproteobacteria bacterium]|nr:MAG: hypothetical protein BMS9Abin26_1132 [Gammaproteobacteria bacterium]
MPERFSVTGTKRLTTEVFIGKFIGDLLGSEHIFR